MAAAAEVLTLIERNIAELALEEDRQTGRVAQWDTNLAEITVAAKTQIPAIVEQRCRAATHRSNCGLLGEVRHAWASADDLLHLWDYHLKDPQVLVIPADSAIVSVSICPPRRGVFDPSSVHYLLIICTRLSVTLVGLQLTHSNDFLNRPLASQDDGLGIPVATLGAGPMGRQGTIGSHFGPRPSNSGLQGQGSSLVLVPLDGYSARTEGAIFHCISHTADGHIFLSSGAPQLFELAYSRDAGWFHSKCRLIRHATGLWSRVRDFLSLNRLASARIRIVACAPHDYVVTVDDTNNIRLFGLQDVSMDRDDSVSMLEELAAISISEINTQLMSLTKQSLSSQVITHIFPSIGLDRQLRLRVVTGSGERLLFLCSSTVTATAGDAARAKIEDSSKKGAAATATAAGKSSSLPLSGPTSATAAAATTTTTTRTTATATTTTTTSRVHGFWLKQADRAKPDSASAISVWSQGGKAGSAVRRSACLQEVRDPCLFASGVWLAASPKTGTSSSSSLPPKPAPGSELMVTARVEDGTGSIGTTGGPRNLFTSLALDSPVFDVAEEISESMLGAESTSDTSSDFRSTRYFAVLMSGSVQVLRLSLKSQVLRRPPRTAAECCSQFAQLALPPADCGSAAGRGAAGEGPTVWSWTSDDIEMPSLEEQMRFLESGNTLPPEIRLGRWMEGFLRYVATVLRPVWSSPLVKQLAARSAPLASGQDFTLVLTSNEETVRSLLARLQPAVRFARQQGLQGAPATAPAVVPTSAAARARMFLEQPASSHLAVRVQRTLAAALELAERTEQVLGLMAALHNQKSAYRVLRSAALAGEPLQALLTTPLGAIVASPEAMAPAVALCTAAVVESGLVTPLAGGLANPVMAGAKDLIQELQTQCPGLLEAIGLDYVLSWATARMSDCGGEEEIEKGSHLKDCINVLSKA